MAKQWDEITVLTQPLALCLVKAIVPDIVRQCVCVCVSMRGRDCVARPESRKSGRDSPALNIK